MIALIQRLPPRLVMLASFSGTSVINYTFGLIMGWLLVPGDFGLLAFAQTLILLAGLVLNSGFAWSLTRGLADSDERPALVRGTLVANLILAGAVSGLVLLLFAGGALRSGLEQWYVALLVAAIVPFLAVVAVAQATARGVERFEALAFIQIIEVSSKALGGIGLVLAGGGVAGAIAGFLIGGVVAALVGGIVTLSLITMPLRGALRFPSLKLAGAMFGALLGLALVLNLDILALKVFAGQDRAMVGYYQGAIVLANTPYYLASALLAVLFPQLARLRTVSLSASAVGETLGLILVFLVPIELVLALAPAEVLGLVFPPAYIAGAGVLSILAFGNIALMLLATVSVAFQATGEARVPAVVLMSAAALEVPALWLIVPRFGAAGAALLFSLTCTAALLGLGGRYLALVGPECLKQARGWLARYAAVLGIATFAALALYSATHALLFSLIAGGGLYAAGGVILKLVRFPADLRKRLLSQRSRWKGQDDHAHSSPRL